MIKTILAATDGSEHARKAVALAADLAEKYKARLVLVHVINAKHLTYQALHGAKVEHLIDSDEEITPELENQVLTTLGQRVLDDEKNQIRTATDIVTRLEEGDPAERIVERANAEGADLVVLGSRGLSAFRGLMLGSVSHKVTQLTPCTCVTVK